MPYAGANVNQSRPFPPFAVVLNRRAGRGLAARRWPELQAALHEHGLTYQLIQADSGAEALAALQALEPGVPVLSVGGEGTIGALLPALVGTGRPVAVVPLGSGNDYAGMLGLKAGDFSEALGRLRFAPRAVDALRVNILAGDRAGETRLLLNGLGMGFDAQVNQAMKRAPARLPGTARYAWGAIASVQELKLIEVEAKVDGEMRYSGRSCLCAVMNGTRYGGGFRISPLSDARDGRLNVVASGPVHRAELVSLMLQVALGRHLGHRKVHAGTGKTTHITWAEPIALHLDGDDAGLVTEVQVEVLPGAVQLLNG